MGKLLLIEMWMCGVSSINWRETPPKGFLAHFILTNFIDPSTSLPWIPPFCLRMYSNKKQSTCRKGLLAFFLFPEPPLKIRTRTTRETHLGPVVLLYKPSENLFSVSIIKHLHLPWLSPGEGKVNVVWLRSRMCWKEIRTKNVDSRKSQTSCYLLYDYNA